MKPANTRLSYISAKKAETAMQYVRGLGVRIQIYNIVFAKNRWYIWFVSSDEGADILSIDL